MYKSLKILKILASIMCVFILTLDIVDFVRIFNAKPTIIEKIKYHRWNSGIYRR